MATAYRAISDRTRRRILDLLRERGPMRPSDIAARFPRVTRQAVSKHLRALHEAGLVAEARGGRERWYRLDPRPLRAVTDWLTHYETFWSDRLQTLREIAEADEARRSRR